MKAFLLSLVLASALPSLSSHVSALTFPDCAKGPMAAFPICDPTVAIDTRVDDLISRLTIAEKISQLGNNADAVDRLGLPAYQWWSEALHGVANSPGVNYGGACNTHTHTHTQTHKCREQGENSDSDKRVELIDISMK